MPRPSGRRRRAVAARSGGIIGFGRALHRPFFSSSASRAKFTMSSGLSSNGRSHTLCFRMVLQVCVRRRHRYTTATIVKYCRRSFSVGGGAGHQAAAVLYRMDSSLATFSFSLCFGSIASALLNSITSPPPAVRSIRIMN